jgi:hypothetical protein
MPSHTADQGAHRGSRSQRRRWTALVAAGVALVVLIAGGGAIWAHRPSDAATPGAACADARPTDVASPAVATSSGTALDSSTPASRAALRSIAGLGFSQGYQPLTRLFQGIAGTGATLVRLDLNWSQVEPTGADSYDIGHTIDVYRAARAQGLTVLPVVSGIPAWAVSAPGGCGAAFAAFMHRAAPALVDEGVTALEIGNEVNISGMSPEAYTDDLLIPGSQAFREAGIAAGTTVAVISTGLAPGTTGNGSWSPPDFLRGVYGAGGGRYLDAVGLHPYSWPDAPDSTVAWNWLRGSTSVRAVMLANGDAAKTIWATEYGFPTNSDRGVSDTEQAAYLRSGASLWAAHRWAGSLILYSYRDLQTGDRDPEDNFGVLQSDGTAKPSADVVAQIAAVLRRR